VLLAASDNSEVPQDRLTSSSTAAASGRSNLYLYYFRLWLQNKGFNGWTDGCLKKKFVQLRLKSGLREERRNFMRMKK